MKTDHRNGRDAAAPPKALAVRNSQVRSLLLFVRVFLKGLEGLAAIIRS